MRELKAAVIGAGSTYTPELIEGFINRSESLNFRTFCLMDINEEKLRTISGLVKRMFEKKGFTGKLIFTQNLDEALTGADYIFAQIRVGGMAARILDEKIPLKHGLLGQETTGAGGFMNALRTVPVMLEIAKKIENICPDAWLINFSNPSGIVAEALLNHSNIKMIGLCNSFINMHASIGNKLGTTDFDYEYLGLNHLSWITSVTSGGKELVDTLKPSGGKMQNIPDYMYEDDLLDAVPAIPSSYLSYFYLRDKQLQKCMQAEKSRGEICLELEENLLAKYKDPGLNEKPKELASRGGSMYSTAAVSVADAIENDKNEFHVVNVKNNGAVSFMDENDVLELKCTVSRNGIKPVPVPKMDILYIKGMMQAVKAYEKLTVRAVMNKSRADAIAALMVHPLIGDYSKSVAALDDMLEANAPYLTIKLQ